MANFTAFLAARTAKATKSIKEIVDIIVKLGRKIDSELI